MAEIMDEYFLKQGRANGTRWVEHKLKALLTMISNWKLVVMHLMSYAKDATNRAEDRATARGNITKIRQVHLLFAFCCRFIG